MVLFRKLIEVGEGRWYNQSKKFERLDLVMKIWGHYESVKIQGSQRTAEVYVPTFLNYGTLPFLVFITPFAIIISSGDGFEVMKTPIVLLFTLATSSLSFLFILGTVKATHNLRRILKGELIARTGELYVVSKMSYGIRGRLYCYRFAIRDHSTKNGYPEVIYEMSQSLYEKFCAQGGNRSVFHAYFVEFAVLPPEGSSEFRLWNASSKLRKGAQSSSRENIEHYAKLPISCAEVVEIFYIRELSYICKTGNAFLFSRVQ